MARILPERDDLSQASLKNSTSSSTSVEIQRELGESCHLLRQAAGLLSQGDLKGANATLKEAVRTIS